MRLRVLLALAGGLATVACAHAQDRLLGPAEALDCMTPEVAERGRPEYPFTAWKRSRPGKVSVDLIFSHPKRPPAVQVVEYEGEAIERGGFIDAVGNHVRRFRLPCLPSGQSELRLRQEFAFEPDRRAVYESPEAAAAGIVRKELRTCSMHVEGQSEPAYPEELRRYEVQGRVLALLRYAAADRAPEVSVYSRPAHAKLASEVEAFVRGLRAPCFNGDPVEDLVTYTFKLEGREFGLPLLSLPQLMGRVTGIRAQRIEFDTTTMRCPFDLRFTLRRPYIRNSVLEIGETEPSRAPLIAWLRTVELDLDPAALDEYFGDTTTLTVPCLKFDIKPKE